MFRMWDLLAIIIFLIGMAGVGVYFARKNNSTEEYFLGNRSFPGWAIGLSMLGTSISSVTFLALPAAAYILDYRQATSNLAMPLVAILAIVFFIPFFRYGKMTSAFEYLEMRYSVWIRTYAALSFIILQLIRLAIVLYLVSIPVATMMNVHIIWVIIFGGFFIGLYTVIGGIEAVIWTDVVQTIILLVGGLLCLGIIIYALPGGFSQIFQIGSEYDKFSFGSVNWNLDDRTFLVVLILGFVQFATEYSSNQNVVQRYIAAKSMTEARKATSICVIMSVPTWMGFFFLGTCLFVFYKVFPSDLVASMQPEEVLPYFILTKAPPFIGGVIIAACLAAAMSSLDSSINSISTIATVDFYRRFGKKSNDHSQLFFAKTVAVIAGAIMIVGAILMVYIPKESVNDMGMIVGSMFGGGMLSIYLLGFFSTRVSAKSIGVGLVLAILLNIYLMLNTFDVLPDCLSSNIHSYWTSILVNLVLAVVAYLFAWLLPNQEKDLDRLTIWTSRVK